MGGVLFYVFDYNGERVSIEESALAFCFPSIAGDGSYFFTLTNGQKFRGENVKETTRPAAPQLKYHG